MNPNPPRPIPFVRVQTFFWSADNGGEENPGWFHVDTSPVDSIRFMNVESGLEWIRRRRNEGREIPRVLAVDNSQALCWLNEEHGLIRLNSFGNPVFTVC